MKRSMHLNELFFYEKKHQENANSIKEIIKKIRKLDSDKNITFRSN